MTVAYIAMGANLGRPLDQIETGLRALNQHKACTVLACSPYYRSKAVGPGEQPDYINGVCKISSSLDAEELLLLLQEIEQQNGRTREIHWGPRTLDLDLLLFGDLTLNTEFLTLPHPRMEQRDFVIRPLFDLAPELELPNGHSLATVLQQLEDSGLIQIEQHYQDSLRD
ncbi:MAG: 2-amino-4-hydroxy-6-hydroxymethyldihydropteridine diphosphokinase [Pseudomonadales bacterium]